MIQQEERLRALVESGIALASELSLEAVLDRLVAAAAELTGARYAAFAVGDPSGKGLERFVWTGLEADTVREIGDLPTGRGILGAMIREPSPVRVRDVRNDPRSVGVPPGHPQLSTFLGVPVRVRGVPYGSLYLAQKEDGAEFDEDDEHAATLLAAQAAVAIENARLYESATGWLRRLQSVNEVGAALTGELELPRLLELVCSRLQELVGARLVFIALPTAGGDLSIEAVAGQEGVRAAIGLRLSRATSKSGRVFERRRSERVDSFLDDPEIDQEFVRRFAELTHRPLPTAGLFVPLLARSQAIGVIGIHDKIGNGTDARFTDEDVRIAEIFASRAAVAVDLSERVQVDALRRVVEGQELERKRLARELHDDTGQALASLLLGLRAVEEARDEATRRDALASLRAIAVTALHDVRRLAVELRPRALDDFGLVAALERLVAEFGEQTGLRAEFEARLPGRLSEHVETALYRIVQEGLTNVVKDARASHVSVLLIRQDRGVSVVIEDDGRGVAAAGGDEQQLALVGLRERLALYDGTFELEFSPGTGTTLIAQIPLEPRGPASLPDQTAR